jgi:hypothetical protein
MYVLLLVSMLLRRSSVNSGLYVEILEVGVLVVATVLVLAVIAGRGAAGAEAAPPAAGAEVMVGGTTTEGLLAC